MTVCFSKQSTNRYLAVLFVFTFVMAGQVSAADQPTYWVSENFSEAPNVNFNLANDIPPFAPEVVDLSSLNRTDDDGDIRLCFDNRPLHEARYNSLERIEKTTSPTRIYKFCEHADLRSKVGHFSVDRHIDRNEIITGLVVSRVGDSITCESIFTIQSLFSLLSYNYLNKNGVEIDSINVHPYYIGIFLYDDVINGIKKYLNTQDVIKTKNDFSSSIYYSEVSLEKSWSCLAPAFRLYWQTTLDRCQEGSMQLRKDSLVKQLTYPILKELKSELFDIADQCNVKY